MTPNITYNDQSTLTSLANVLYNRVELELQYAGDSFPLMLLLGHFLKVKANR